MGWGVRPDLRAREARKPIGKIGAIAPRRPAGSDGARERGGRTRRKHEAAQDAPAAEGEEGLKPPAHSFVGNGVDGVAGLGQARIKPALERDRPLTGA